MKVFRAYSRYLAGGVVDWLFDGYKAHWATQIINGLVFGTLACSYIAHGQIGTAALLFIVVLANANILAEKLNGTISITSPA